MLFFGSVVQVFHTKRHFVLNGLPFNVRKHRVNHCNRIGENKQREQQPTEEHRFFLCTDALSLRDARDTADEPQRQYRTENAAAHGKHANAHIRRARHNARRDHNRVKHD